MRPRHSTIRLLEGIVGILLVLVGLGFLVLLAALKYGGELAGDLEVSAVMFGSGAGLIWIGAKFFVARPHDAQAEWWGNLDPLVLKLRTAAKPMAATGCVLTLCHVAAVMRGDRWPAKPLFEALLVGPVLIGLFTLRLLVPGAFQSSVFADDEIRAWSDRTRRLFDRLVRVGWFGFIALPLAWPEVTRIYLHRGKTLRTFLLVRSFPFFTHRRWRYFILET